MIRITGGRRSGKTTALVATFRQDPAGVLVFARESMADCAVQRWPVLRAMSVCAADNVDAAIAGRLPEARLYVDECDRSKMSLYAASRVVAVTEAVRAKNGQ